MKVRLTEPFACGFCGNSMQYQNSLKTVMCCSNAQCKEWGKAYQAPVFELQPAEPKAA